MYVKRARTDDYEITRDYFVCGDTFMGNNVLSFHIPLDEFDRKITKEWLSKYLFLCEMIGITKQDKTHRINKRKSIYITAPSWKMQRIAFKLLRYGRNDNRKIIEDMYTYTKDRGFTFVESLVLAHYKADILKESPRGYRDSNDILQCKTLYGIIPDKELIKQTSRSINFGFPNSRTYLRKSGDRIIHESRIGYYSHPHSKIKDLHNKFKTLIDAGKEKEVLEMLNKYDFKQTGKIL